MLRPKHRPIIALSLRTFLMLDSTSKSWYFAQLGIFPSPTLYKLLRTCPAWTSLSSSSTQTLGTEEATLLQKIGQPLIFPHTGVSVYVLSLLQPPFSPLSHISMSVPVNSLTLCCSPLSPPGSPSSLVPCCCSYLRLRSHKVGRIHNRPHHVPIAKTYLSSAATTGRKFLQIPSARTFRNLSKTPTNIFKIIYFAKWMSFFPF